MLNYFKFSLPGWKLLLMILLPMFVFGLMMGIIMHSSADVSNPLANLLNMITIQIVAGILTLLIYYVYLKLVIANISHREGDFQFRGNFGRFAWIVLRDGVLSVATLGIYSFWFTENMLSYIYKNSQFGDRGFKFYSKGGDLFEKYLIILLPLSLPYYYLNFKNFIDTIIGQPATTEFNIVMFFSYLLLMIGTMIYSYKRLEWMLNISCDDYKIDLVTDFWTTVRFLLLQIAFSILTLGLYIPAAIAKINKYYINSLYIRNEEKEFEINNEVSTFKSWGYIWGQFLLCIITLGIYLSWAATGIMRWFIESTEFEGFDVIAEEPEAIMLEEDFDEAVLEEKEETEESESSDEIL